MKEEVIKGITVDYDSKTSIENVAKEIIKKIKDSNSDEICNDYNVETFLEDILEDHPDITAEYVKLWLNHNITFGGEPSGLDKIEALIQKDSKYAHLFLDSIGYDGSFIDENDPEEVQEYFEGILALLPRNSEGFTLIKTFMDENDVIRS